MKTSRDASSSPFARSSPSRARARPRQLSDSDAVFLSVERPEAPSHIAGLTILDPTDCPEFGFDRFLEILRERIDRVARFRWKLFEPPFGIDRAYWIEAEDFDVADHVNRVAIPQPGDRAALAEMAGFLHAQPLDRGRPLWETWWIEGLEGGRIATLLKIHHCLMDGQGGMGLSEILMDLTPEPVRDRAPAVDARESSPRRPAFWEVGRAALTNGLRIPQAVADHSRRALRGSLSRVFEREREEGAAPAVPRVAFNGRLTRERGFSFATVPLGPLRDAKKHFDVTLNDVLLELVSSTLRRGLLAQGQLPEEAVVGLCPVSLRQQGDSSFGNQISSMPVSLATQIEDVPGRLAAIHESAKAAKRRLAGGAFETLTALGECLAPGVLRLLTRVAHEVPSLIPLPGNLVISNVRGLPVPLYMAGARVEELYPISMLQVANGMNVTAVSHDDQVDFGFLVDRSLVRDPWIYADGIHEALRELEAAVASRSIPRPADAASRPESAPEPDPAPADAEPLDLMLIMSGLRHLRAPDRESHSQDE